MYSAMCVTAYTCPYCIDNVASTAFMTFAGVGDQDLQIWIFIQDLFDTAIVPALFPRHLSASLLGVIVLIIVAQVSRS